MNNSSRENLSALAKERWAACADIGKVLGLSKTYVHDKLYGKLCQTGYLDKVLRRNRTAIDQVRSWPEYTAANQSVCQCDMAPIEMLKIADWFVRKLGSVNNARKAIDLLYNFNKQVS